MNTLYNTHDKFKSASEKFPRFINARRRPDNSIAGKLLQSYIEEIGAVEDAIIDYKKDFFIENYLDRSEDITAYLYSARVGEIEDLSALNLLSPVLEITEDKKFFLDNLSTHAYYQDGCILFNEKCEEVHYTYNQFEYKVVPEEIHVWNIFDDFGWWVGLERLPKETNKAFMYRIVDVFRERPSSSKIGLKNVIKNTLYNYGHIGDEEIRFELPNENNMAIIGEDGLSLYDHISSFNRDIARTKKWDIDYWSNNFAKFDYLPHAWETKVANYKNGVGYNDSLKVSTVKDLDTELGTSVSIYGYKKSEKKIEEYLRSQNIKKELTLKLKKYLDVMNPIPVQYKITASTLSELKYPNRAFINLYVVKNKKINYPLEQFYESDNGLEIVKNNKLVAGKKYRAELLPDNTFKAEECTVKNSDGNVVIDLLRSYNQFVRDDYGNIINHDQKFYGESVYDFSSTSGFKDSENGISLIDNSVPGVLSFETEGSSVKNPNLKLTLDYEIEKLSLMNNPLFILAKGFKYNAESNKYESSTNTEDYASCVIDFEGNYLEYSLPRAISSSVSVNVYIDGEKDISNSYSVLNLNKSARTPEPISLPKYSHIRVEIIRLSGNPSIENIFAKRIKTKVIVDKEEIIPRADGSFVLPERDKCDVEVTIENLSKTDFELKSVIVGKKLTKANSTYLTEEFTAGENQYLDVINLGDVKLFDVDTNTYVDYSPYDSYKNNSDIPLDLYLDLSAFTSIGYSYPEIKTSSDNRKYITIEAGEELSSIEIYGEYKNRVSRKSFADLLRLGSNQTVKFNKNTKRCYVENNGRYRFDSEFVLDKQANLTEIDLDNEDKEKFEVAFISDEDKNVEVITDTYGGTFDFFYLYDKNSKEYIAYNTQNIVQEITGDLDNGEKVSIVNSFSPAIPKDSEVIYEISDPIISSETKFPVSVTFVQKNLAGENLENTWTLTSSAGILIAADFGEEKDRLIKTEELAITEKFNLSNNISLQNSYEVDNKTINLEEYIISVPDFVKVQYEEVTTARYSDGDGNTLYVETDGFNKLPHTNITKIEKIVIGGKTVSSSDYKLLGEAGFVWWKNPELYSKPFSITYTYKKPVSLIFSSLDMLYDTVGYTIDTLDLVNNEDYMLTNIQSGEIISVDPSKFSQYPDIVSAICNNPVYTATVENTGYVPKVLVTKIGEDNELVIHNGYYYIDGNEYWYFTNKKYRDVDKIDGLETFNAEKLGGGLQLFRESTNFLKNSRMDRKVLNPTASFNFANYHTIPNVSSANHFGACETLSAWKTYRMNLTPSNEYDGDAIIFDAENDSSYAIMDITAMIKKNKLFTAWVAGNIKLSIARDVAINGQKLSKSLYLSKVADLVEYKDKVYFDCSMLDTNNDRFFLIVSGNGTLIEIIVSDIARFKQVTDFEEDFEKAITKFGLKIEEKAAARDTILLDFIPTGIQFNDTELSKDLVLRTGSTADWGITKIKSFDFSKDLLLSGFNLRNDILTATADNAYIETNPMQLSNIASIGELYVKINDYPVNNLADFKITFLGSNTLSNDYQVLGEFSNCNVASISGKKLKNFIKIRIEAVENKDITGIELFANYVEEEKGPKIADISSGFCFTKIYDLGAVGNYRLKDIETEETNPENIRYYIRGIRFQEFDNTYTELYSKEENHVFDNYRYVQFKIELKTKDARAKIKKFIMEAV